MAVAVLTTVAELRTHLADTRIAFVPTMGALHEGHLALAERARELVAEGEADTIVASIFVNPLQFAAGEDLEKYPRTLNGDLAKLEAAGVTYVFAPSVDEMYPDGPLQTKITAGHVGSLFEGRTRAGHFDGVLTVVAKLLNIVQPRAIVFGQKDAQQVFLVQRMVRDLSIPTRVVVVETVREDGGLALSSRNRFLDARQHRAATALSAALEAAVSSADRGIDAVLAAAQSVVMGEGQIELDYLAVVVPSTFLPVNDDYHGPARVLIAAKLGTTRLIDNEAIYLG